MVGNKLKITAHLTSLVSITRDIVNIDGLIAYSVASEMGLNDTEYDAKIKIDIPLEYDESLRLYKGSCGFYYGKESSEKWYKRWDGENEIYLECSKKILTGRGEYKNYSMPIKVFNTNKIEFYAVGDGVEIERLLNSNVNTIGKKGSMGYGQIREWTVENIDEDYSFVFPSGNLSRQIPFSTSVKLINKYKDLKLDTNMSKHCTFEFPYWDISKQEQCFVPNVKFKNNDDMLKYIK